MNSIKFKTLIILSFTLIFSTISLLAGTWVNNDAYKFSVYFPENQEVIKSNVDNQTTYSQKSRKDKVTQRYDGVSILRGSVYELSTLNKQTLNLKNFNDYVIEKIEYDTGDFTIIEGHSAFKYQVTRQRYDYEDEHINGLLIDLPKGLVHLRTKEYKQIHSNGIEHYSDTPYTDYFFNSFN